PGLADELGNRERAQARRREKRRRQLAIPTVDRVARHVGEEQVAVLAANPDRALTPLEASGDYLDAFERIGQSRKRRRRLSAPLSRRCRPHAPDPRHNRRASQAQKRSSTHIVPHIASRDGSEYMP